MEKREKVWNKFIYYFSFCHYYGVVMFIIGFATFLAVTLVYPDFPTLWYWVYPDIPPTPLQGAILNGVAAGAIFWPISILLVILFNPN